MRRAAPECISAGWIDPPGEPGDVYLMNLQVLHSRNRNTRPTPRLMITQRFLLASVRGQIRTRYYEPPEY